ncbi:MAG TPA: IS1182 family transposase [Sulfurimonas sp.]|nr:IS1182 family transposase [Sulfurimonas sp.]
MKAFKASNRNQPFLLPPSIQDWLPKEHLARFIVEIVEQLDLSKIESQYSGKGKDAYHPQVMLCLLFYGYATGVFSSRKIERATYDSVAFRYIAANTHPDHDTIATFRKRFLKELSELFVQILSIAQEMGVLKVGKVSLDGTKVKANASKHKALSYAHATKLQKQLEDEVAILLKKAQSADNKEDNDGMNIPEEIARREDKLEVIKAAKLKIEQRAKERHKQELKEYDEKIKKREAKEKLTGKKTGGKKPQPPKSKEPNPKDQVNLTDEESRIMPISSGGYMQAYNVQASVEHDSRLIVHQHVTQNVNDKKEIVPTLQWFKDNPTLMPDSILADAGYYSDENVRVCEAEKITPYISFGKEQHNQPLEDRFTQPEVLPEDATDIEKMKHRLQTKEGKEIYALRKSMIEPLFGVMKHVMGFRQFILRGFEKAQGEWTLMCIAYNLKRLHTIRA